MSKTAWKFIAIAEFILIAAAIAFASAYLGCKEGLLHEGVKGVLQVIASAAMLVLLFVGGIGCIFVGSVALECALEEKKHKCA